MRKMTRDANKRRGRRTSQHAGSSEVKSSSLDHGLPGPGQVPQVHVRSGDRLRGGGETLDKNVLEEGHSGEERHDGDDGGAVPSRQRQAKSAAQPRRLLREAVDTRPVGVPVGRVVIDNNLEAHALHVDGDAAHGAGREAVVAAAAQQPRVVAAVAVAVPVVPHLRSGVGEVIEHETRLRVEPDAAVLPSDAVQRREHDIAGRGVAAEDEAAGSLGLRIEGELQRALGLAAR